MPLAGTSCRSASGLVCRCLVEFCGLMGSARGPVALFANGLFLLGSLSQTGLGESAWLVVAKLVLHPLVHDGGWQCRSSIWIFEVTRGAVLMRPPPTVPLSFVIARNTGFFLSSGSSARFAFNKFSPVVTVSALLGVFWYG